MGGGRDGYSRVAGRALSGRRRLWRLVVAAGHQGPRVGRRRKMRKDVLGRGTSGRGCAKAGAGAGVVTGG